MKRIVSVILIMCLLLVGLTPAKVDAKSKNKKAYTAYAKAVNNDANDFYSSEVSWYVDDVNGDKVKDLIVFDWELFRVYTYKNGKAVVLAEKYPDRSIYYHKKDKVFWETGEGDGGWANKFKVTKKGIKNIVSYNAHMYSAPQYWKEKNGKKTKISSSKYRSVWKNAVKKSVKFNSSSFGLLEEKLEKMGK